LRRPDVNDTLILLGFAVPALMAHEAGHAAAAHVLHLPWRIVWTWHGPGVKYGSSMIRLARWQVVVTAACGPLANIALAAITYQLGLGFFVLTNLEFIVLSFLPFLRSDGSRILRPGRAIRMARAGVV
jgi:Zn-dependent protease